MHENPWTTRATRLIYENAWIRVREDDVLRPDGEPGIYGVVHFKNKAVGVLPVADNGDVWLVGQYRYPLEEYSWEIPEGGCPEGESPEETARRELEEETGLVAGKLATLLTTHLSNSVSDEWGVVFRATDLSQGDSRPEGSERIQMRRVSFTEALAMLERGAITDSLSVMALLREALDRARVNSHQRRSLNLALREERLSIVRLNAADELPAWAAESGFLSVTRTDDELSIVAETRLVPSECRASGPWRALRVAGAMPLSETGVAAALTKPLAESNIPLFLISTYDTDYILVLEDVLERSCTALRDAGHRIE